MMFDLNISFYSEEDWGALPKSMNAWAHGPAPIVSRKPKTQLHTQFGNIFPSKKVSWKLPPSRVQTHVQTISNEF